MKITHVFQKIKRNQNETLKFDFPTAKPEDSK